VNSPNTILVLKGSLGFDYNFNAIQNESNELFLAYKEMFEVAISQGVAVRNIIRIYAPWLDYVIVCFLAPEMVFSTDLNPLARQNISYGQEMPRCYSP